MAVRAAACASSGLPPMSALPNRNVSRPFTKARLIFIRRSAGQPSFRENSVVHEDFQIVGQSDYHAIHQWQSLGELNPSFQVENLTS
jgi:hypothetical protein